MTPGDAARDGLVGMANLDRQLRVTAANEDFTAIWDGSLEKMYGRSLLSLVPAPIGARLRTGFADIVQGRRTQFGLRDRRGSALTGFGMSGEGGVTSGLVVIYRPAPPDKPALEVTDTEARVLEGVARGASTAELAGRLHLSRAGIEYHIRRMLDRFGLPNRAALVSRAYSDGLLEVGQWPPRVPRRPSR